MSELPTCQVSNPTCGACGDETRHDGDYFYCEGCHLSYGDGEDFTEAEFYDTSDPACGVPCTNYWHTPNAIREGVSYSCKPCSLPGPHTSDHWHPCEPTERKD